MKGIAGVSFLGAMVLALAVMAPARSKAADNNPDVVEVRNYKLTMDKIQKAAAASDEINKKIATDAVLKQRMESGSSDDKPIDQKTREFDANYPQLAAIVHAHGLTTREFIVVELAFLNDVMIVGMKKQGIIKEYPPNSVTPENAAFVEQNFDTLQELGKKLAPPDSQGQ